MNKELSREERAEKMLRDIFLMMLIMACIMFFCENRAYFLSYLPHQSQYEERLVYVSDSTVRGYVCEVRLESTAGKIEKAYVPQGFSEPEGTLITVGYSKESRPAIVRVRAVITMGQIMALIMTIACLAGIRLRTMLMKDEDR